MLRLTKEQNNNIMSLRKENFMKRSMIRLFSVFLSVMMIISSANFIVTAEGDPEITENTQANENTNEIIYTQELTEDVSLRDKFTKHYA